MRPLTLIRGNVEISAMPLMLFMHCKNFMGGSLRMQLGGQPRVVVEEEEKGEKSWEWDGWDNLGGEWGDGVMTCQMVSVGLQTATCARLTWCWSAWSPNQVQPISHSRSLPTPRKEDGRRGFFQAVHGKSEKEMYLLPSQDYKHHSEFSLIFKACDILCQSKTHSFQFRSS